VLIRICCKHNFILIQEMSIQSDALTELLLSTTLQIRQKTYQSNNNTMHVVQIQNTVIAFK